MTALISMLPALGGAGGGAGVSFSSLLSGGLTLASAGASLMGGVSQSRMIAEEALAEMRSLDLQSRDQELQARQAELQGKQEANNILEDLTRTIAAQRLAFSANGFDPLTGTAESVYRQTSRAADLSLGTSRQDAVLRAMTRRRQAQEMIYQRGVTSLRSRAESSAALTSGAVSALGTLGDYVTRQVDRGDYVTRRVDRGEP